MTNALNMTAAAQDIASIIQGKPAVPLSRLPKVWQNLATEQGATKLSDAARHDYVEAARLFAYHGTPLSREALTVIGDDFSADRYPDLKALQETAQTPLQQKTVAAVAELFGDFGYDAPAALYVALLASAFDTEETESLKLFKQKDLVARDRLWDAALHAMLLVTPVGLYVQSLFSRHGLRFTHVMNCSCVTRETAEAAFDIPLKDDIRAACLQNMIAAAFEQYGVNAATSRQARGF
jgi:hypothetical protein